MRARSTLENRSARGEVDVEAPRIFVIGEVVGYEPPPSPRARRLPGSPVTIPAGDLFLTVFDVAFFFTLLNGLEAFLRRWRRSAAALHQLGTDQLQSACSAHRLRQPKRTRAGSRRYAGRKPRTQLIEIVLDAAGFPRNAAA